MCSQNFLPNAPAEFGRQDGIFGQITGILALLDDFASIFVEFSKIIQVTFPRGRPQPCQAGFIPFRIAPCAVLRIQSEHPGLDVEL